MKKLVFIIAACLAFAGIIYVFQNRPVANTADFAPYLNKQHFEAARKTAINQIRFWENKLSANPGNYVYQKQLAGLYAADFKLSGDIRQLKRSDSLLHLVNERIPNQVDVLMRLAANAITRHAFREAENYAMQAYRTGEKKFNTSLLRTDVHLERGDFSTAEMLLKDIASDSHFDYLIR